MITLSVLMPVYNEKATLSEIVARVRKVPIDKEIILVDNCSTDGTRELLQEWLATGQAEAAESAASGTNEAPGPGETTLRIALQTINQGKGASVRRALSLARGQWVIVQDADLEYDPHDFLKLLAAARRAENRRGQPVAVFGTRLEPGSAARRSQPRTAFYYGRLGLSRLFRLLYGTALSDVATCYKLMRRTTVRALHLQGSGFDLDFEIAARLRRRGLRIVEVPISYHPRTEQEGKKIRALHDGWRAAWTLLRCRFDRFL